MMTSQARRSSRVPAADRAHERSHASSASRDALVHLAVRPPFSFAHARAFVASFPPCQGDLIVTDDGAILGALSIDGHAVGWRLRGGDDDGAPIETLTLAVVGAPTTAIVLEAARLVSLFVSADDDLGEFYARAAGDAAPYRALVARLHGLHHVRFLTLAEITCHAILAQRTPIGVASAQKARLAHAFGRAAQVDGVTVPAFPELRDLTAASEADFVRVLRHPEKVRRLVAAVREVATIGEDALRHGPYDDAYRSLCAIRGVGPFSARMILLRGLGRMDAMDPRGPAFTRAARAVYGAGWSPDDALARYGTTIGYWSYYLRVGA